MAATTEFEEMALNWCREQRALDQASLDMLESGASRTGEDTGSGWRDTTAERIATLKKQIADMDRLIAAYERREADQV